MNRAWKADGPLQPGAERRSTAIMKPIKLLPCVSHVTAEELTRSVEGDICACDFYVEGAEAGVEVPGGYQLNGILDIDHHAPGTRMARVISSANVALAHVRRCASWPTPETRTQ